MRGWSQCPTCRGLGVVGDEPCELCDGTLCVETPDNASYVGRIADPCETCEPPGGGDEEDLTRGERSVIIGAR